MLTVFLHGDGPENFSHRFGEWWYYAELYLFPVIIVLLIGWLIWKKATPPKGKRRRVDDTR